MVRNSKQVPEIVIPSAIIEVPYVEGLRPDDAIRHINIHLDTHDGNLFKAIGLGLAQAGAKLRNGTPLGHGRSFTGDTLRWILEAVEDSVNDVRRD